MKALLLSISALFLGAIANGQNLHDSNWIVVNANEFPVVMQWTNNTLTMKVGKPTQYSGDYFSVVSNASGQLKFFANGCGIMGNNYKALPKGDTINPGEIWNSYCKYNGSYPYNENVLLLPMPNDTNKYVAFHNKAIKQDIFDTIPWPIRYLYYSEIDARLNKGIGDVTQKNVLIKEDTLQDPIYAVRHANGKDWWVIAPQIITLGFQRLLLTDEGVRYVGEQNLRHSIFGYSTSKGQGNFSPDGTKLVMGDPYSGIYLLSFDRCTGLFNTLFRHIDIGYNQYSCVGVEFSPNSRFLYVSLGHELWQYDTWKEDLVASKILIDTFDGFKDPFYTRFFQQQLAPDNKIYIGSTNSNLYMGIIHQPDSLGKACGFKQHDLKLPDYYYIGIPNMPNYRLGASDPNCQLPLAVKDYNKADSDVIFDIYPNPTAKSVYIRTTEIPQLHTYWELYDTKGTYLFSQLLHEQQVLVNFPMILPNGIYYWKIKNKNSCIQTGKIIIQQ